MSLILVADDEMPSLELMAESLGDLGHQVLQASDGEDALMLARSHSPDLIITDFMMPRRDGVELIRALRAERKLAQTPVILISAAKPRSAGEATLFLPKPIHLDVLEARVAGLLAAVADGGVSAPTPRPPSTPAKENGAPRVEILNWVAHELKSPLSATRMSAELLRRRLEANGEETDVARVRVIVRGLDRMTSLINSVLDAAALGEGKIALERKPTRVLELVRRLVSLWQDLHPEMSFALSTTKVEVLANVDPSRVEQVLENLISNAVKYGGAAKRVEVEVSHSPGTVVITVHDHGVGISAAELPELFERFHRGQSGGEGHGLGLYIASVLARLHGGALTARSELGKGSSFALHLPCSV